MSEFHNEMIKAGKTPLPRSDNVAEQLTIIIKILHMMPVLRNKVCQVVQDEIAHYLDRPNDFFRAYTGELIPKNPKVDYSKQYKDKSTRGRGW